MSIAHPLTCNTKLLLSQHILALYFWSFCFPDVTMTSQSPSQRKVGSPPAMLASSMMMLKGQCSCTRLQMRGQGRTSASSSTSCTGHSVRHSHVSSHSWNRGVQSTGIPVNKSPVSRSPVNRGPVNRESTQQGVHSTGVQSTGVQSPGVQSAGSPVNRSPVNRSPVNRSPVNREDSQ